MVPTPAPSTGAGQRRSLHVVQLLPAMEAGGVERSTLEIAAALVARGHRATVVSAGGRLCAALRDTGAEHVDLDVGRRSLLVLRNVPRLRRLLDALRPDIVHARSRLPAWIGSWALRSMRAPRPRWITTVHGLNSPGRYSRILTTGERVICVSNSVRDHILAHYPDVSAGRLVVIPRGIDPAQFPRSADPGAAWRESLYERHPQLRGGPLLLLPGRGTRLKGHADALALLARLHAQGCQARLWLLGAEQPGRARYAEQLRQAADRLGVGDSVALSPPRSDIAEAYAVCDLVLQLSRHPEAFGRTVLEALAVGRPVLGWDHGGVGELLAELYPRGRIAPGDIEMLSAAALQLLQSAPPTPAPPHSLAAMQAATVELYERVVEDG